MKLNELIQAAHHVLNGRSRGRERWLALLAEHGVPTERGELERWVASATRDMQQADGYWFSGWSARTSNGVEADLPIFGKFGCRIRAAKPRTFFIDDETGWGFDFGGEFGVSGVGCETEREAQQRAEAALRRAGFVPEWRVAAEVAKSQAKARHEAKLAESAAYAAQYGA